jgi:CubicO group peptidase (beta-lactamase class C family)
MMRCNIRNHLAVKEKVKQEDDRKPYRYHYAKPYRSFWRLQFNQYHFTEEGFEMRPRIKALLIYCLLLVFVSAPVARAQEAPLAGFDDYVNKAIKDWEVPGLAIAIVKNDTVVLAKGYGVRKLGDPATVNEKSLFAIGSCSKAFTSAALAMLVDEGKLKWDDPATKHLKGFQLYDPYVTREITVRDLLSHRSGLGRRGDLLWYGSPYDRNEILRRIRYLEPETSFRSAFGYQNIMFLAAGQIIPAITGKSWDEFVASRIFAPLGMKASNTTITAFKKDDNVAMPHADIDGKVQTVAWRNIDNIAPAGSINSNVEEMAQWLRLLLADGKYKNEQLLSPGVVKEILTPQTVIRTGGPMARLNPDTHFAAYGLGWGLADYRGRKIAQHTGGIDGMTSLVAMMPEEKLGFVILTNMNGTSLPPALMYRIFDAFLQVPQKDWSGELLKVFKMQVGQIAAVEKAKDEERVKGTSPSLALSNYAGAYSNEMYGDAKVTEENGHLVLRYGPAFVGDLAHWNYDTFRVTWRDPMLGKGFVTFTLNASGKTDQVKIEDLADFKRIPEK